MYKWGREITLLPVPAIRRVRRSLVPGRDTVERSDVVGAKGGICKAKEKERSVRAEWILRMEARDRAIVARRNWIRSFASRIRLACVCNILG